MHCNDPRRQNLVQFLGLHIKAPNDKKCLLAAALNMGVNLVARRVLLSMVKKVHF